MQLIVSLAWDWRSSVAVCAWVVSGVGIADHITKSKKARRQRSKSVYRWEVVGRWYLIAKGWKYHYDKV